MDDEEEIIEDSEEEDETYCELNGHDYDDEGVCIECGAIDEPDDFTGATEGDR